jgi:two-component system, chemotaxis family, sensor kinase CheA
MSHDRFLVYGYEKNMEKKKILIIEDESMLQRALTEFLETENFEVANALDGEKGLAMVEIKNPDLILLDIILPKKDGYEILKELKENEKTKKIPVIILTNLESNEDIQRAFDLGATTYLVKSNYKLEDVIRKIKETLKM